MTFPDQTSEQDAQTLQGCLKDVPGAWETFVGRFGRLFAWVVDRTARSRGIALSTIEKEESVAEILFELVRNDKVVLRSFAGRSSLATYLTVIARRVTVHRFMRRAPRQTEVTDMVDPQTQATILVEQRDHIESLMAFLNESEAKLVRLHHLEHRSYGDQSSDRSAAGIDWSGSDRGAGKNEAIFFPASRIKNVLCTPVSSARS